MLQDFINSVPHYVLPFLIVISVVVFVHEFGHYWVARRCGIKIEAFSIGFGGEIFGWTDKHGTRWKVCWLPLGGYVKMFGDSNAASMPDGSTRDMSTDEKSVAFFHQSVNKRMAVVFAGPAVNYLFAIVVWALLFTFHGMPYTSTDISAVKENGPAAAAGLLKGDHIVSIDGNNVERFEDIKRMIALNSGTPLDITVERAGAPMHISVTPQVVKSKDRFGTEYTEGLIGITADKKEFKSLSPPMAVYYAAAETWNLTRDSLKGMWQMIIGVRSSDEIRGALGIAQMSGHIAEDGLVSLIWFMGFVSVNLGLINLFPVPLLDGGHLAYYLVEKIRGRPLHERVQEAGMRFGIALVLSLMIFSTWNDLVHLKVISYLRDLLFS